MKYINIVTSGDVGSGKTTLSKMLAKKLHWKYVSAGDYFRTFHKKHHIPLEEKLMLPEDVDKKFDSAFKETIAITPSTVFEGHYQGWNTRDISTAFRILITIDPVILLERVANRQDNESLTQVQRRAQINREAFKQLYGDADYLDPKYFALIIDNTFLTKKELLEKVYKKLPNEFKINTVTSAH